MNVNFVFFLLPPVFFFFFGFSFYYFIFFLSLGVGDPKLTNPKLGDQPQLQLWAVLPSEGLEVRLLYRCLPWIF